MLARIVFGLFSVMILHCPTAFGQQQRQRAPPTAVRVTSSIAPIGALCRALKRPSCPSGIVEESFLGLTADSSSFLVKDAPSGRWELLGSKPLRTMLSALAPITIRVGGTFTDFTSMPGPNPGISKREPNQYNFSVAGWSAINRLVQSLPNSQLVVSVNGLLRHWDKPSIPWDPTNAKAFIADNIAKGYHIFGYELGNEPGCWGSHGGNVPASIHAKDFGVLQGLLADAYPDASTRPLVLGPDTTGCGGANSSGDLREILKYEPEWNVTTVHLYSVMPNVNASAFLKAAQKNTMCTRAATQLGWLKASKLNTPLWNGEGGASYLTTGGGGYLHQFGGALSLMNNLGCLPAAGVQRLLKHDLFENMFVMFKDNLVNTTARIQPYAPYWSAWLFKQLVGTAFVMETTVAAPYNNTFHAYTFTHVRAEPIQAAALLFVNLDRSLRASVALPPHLSCTSVEAYHLTAAGSVAADSALDRVLNAPGVALNGEILAVTAHGELPTLSEKGIVGSCEASVKVEPLSAAIVVVY